MLIDLIRAAIRDRSTGKVGIVLSGGLDSSTVACLADQELPTFTGYYDLPGFDERQWAHLAAHPNHHDIEITPHDFVEHFDAMAASAKPPIQGMGTFGQFMVARYVSRYVDVALSGEGSDELFGGYARTLIAAGEKPMAGYENYKVPEGYPLNDLAAALQWDLDRLPDLLAVDDQMCAAWGVEARAPFTDQRIVDYALSLPPTARVGKRHLRNAVRGIVPDAIIDRTDKMGFPAPYALWAQEEPVRSFVLERIGYLPNPETPWDRKWWYDMFRDRAEAVA